MRIISKERQGHMLQESKAASTPLPETAARPLPKTAATGLVRYLTAFIQQAPTATSSAVIKKTSCHSQDGWWAHPAAAEAALTLGQLPWGPRASLGRPQQPDSCSGLLQAARSSGHQAWVACCGCAPKCRDAGHVMEIKQSFWDTSAGDAHQRLAFSLAKLD